MIQKKVKSVDYYEAYGKEFKDKRSAEEYVEELNSLLNCQHVVVSVNPELKEIGNDGEANLSYPELKSALSRKKEVTYDTIVYSVNGKYATNKVLFLLQIELESPLVNLSYFPHDLDFSHDELNMEDVYPRYIIHEPKKFETINDMLKFFNEDLELIKIKYNTNHDGVLMVTNQIIMNEVEMERRKGVNLL